MLVSGVGQLGWSVGLIGQQVEDVQNKSYYNRDSTATLIMSPKQLT